VFDWSQKAAEIWRGSNTTARRQIPDSICLNRQVSDVTLVTAERKPVDFFVERLPLKKSRDDCDSFEPTPDIIADFVAVAMECRLGALDVLEELVMKAQTTIAGNGP
jgi:hypothetical protein